MAATKLSSKCFGLTLVFLGLVSCNPCENSPKSKIFTNDGRLQANFYERNCGATTDFSSIVNVQNASEKFDPEDGLVFVAKGRYDISIVWQTPNTLIVTCQTCVRKNIFRQVVALGDIDVQYRIAPAK